MISDLSIFVKLCFIYSDMALTHLIYTPGIPLVYSSMVPDSSGLVEVRVASKYLSLQNPEVEI